MRIRVGHQHSWFLSILARFVAYYTLFWLILARFLDCYSLFWGPRVISTIDEPRGAFTCRSSTLVVFVNSGPFRGLLHTVLGSRSDFHGCQTSRSAYMSVINNRRLGRFWPVSWTISQFWGPGVISTIAEPRGAFMCRSSTLTILANSCPFRALLTDLGSQSDFHD